MSRPDPTVPIGPTASDPAALFDAERRHLFGVAYRLLGSVGDAEDVVQDVFERWLGADRSQVTNPAAYLTTMTTRSAIDRLRSARAKREVYVGPWLPEPLPTASSGPASPAPPTPEAVAELDESLSIGYLHLLEQLTPHERAAHLLHDVYDFSFREVAAMIGREEANCRQLASRARSKLRATRPDRDRVRAPDIDADLVDRLIGAVTGGDVEQVMGLLADDVVHVSDGGANHRAARQPVVGSDRVARLLVNLAGRIEPADYDHLAIHAVEVNGQVGRLVMIGPRPELLLAVDTDGVRIERIWAVVNPDKLQAVLATLPR